MKKKNTITLEEIEENKINEEGGAKQKKKVSFMKFWQQDVLPFFYVCLVLAILFILVGTVSSIDSVKSLGCTEMYCGDGAGLIDNFVSKLEMLVVTVVAVLVPYFYLPFLGFIGYIYYEGIAFAHAMNVYGYFGGIMRYFLPAVLNIIVISVVTSVCVYLVKILTAKFRYNRKNAMNFTKFRLKVYEMTKKEDKYNELLKKSEEKDRKLEGKNRKVEWKYVLCIFAVMAVLQFISVCIESLVI